MKPFGNASTFAPLNAFWSAHLMTSILRTVTVWAALTCGLHGVAIAAIAGAAMPPTVAIDNCRWDHPGVNPFMGDVVAAVDRYTDIAPEVRARLKARMGKRQYDEIVTIRRDSITGRNEYGSVIREMHFGVNRLCHSVTRAAWSPQMQERGLVYCEAGQCILVPTVCRNVSRITRGEVGNERAEAEPFAPELLPAEPPEAVVKMADVAAPAEPFAIDGVPSFGGLSAPSAMSGPAAASGGASMAGFGFASVAGGGFAGLSHGSADAALPRVTAAANTLTTEGPAALNAAPVPEPQTWALMIGGLVLVLAARRRAIH